MVCPLLSHCNALGISDMTITPHDCWLLPGEDDTSRMTAYRELFCDPLSQADIEYIRSSAGTGLPTGNDRFRKEIAKALSIRPGRGKRGRQKKAVD